MQIGDSIFMGGIKYQLAAIDENTFTFFNPLNGESIDKGSNQRSITQLSSFNDSFWNLLSSSFSAIETNSKFTGSTSYDLSNDNYFYNSPIESDAQPINELDIPQDFISLETTPNISSYLSDVVSRNDILVTDTEIEHFEGNIWRTREVYSQAL